VGGVKISLITVTYNAADTIERCISSVAAQNYGNLEYIIIDGGSTDLTDTIVGRYQKYIHTFISEPDKGIYDAMNKGIAVATGDIIGMLNADDFFVDIDVLQKVADAFTTPNVNIVYGDIDFIDKKDKVIRRWRSGKYKHGYFNWGWMPPHPSFYARKQLFDSYGLYKLGYGSAADYELMLRFIHTNKIGVHYINKVMVTMRIGGVSNNNINNRIKAWQNDFKAMQKNGLAVPYITIALKPLRKIIQFIR
jgi:glycosyltransferase involved in cell wall biosynthesis